MIGSASERQRGSQELFQLSEDDCFLSSHHPEAFEYRSPSPLLMAGEVLELWTTARDGRGPRLPGKSRLRGQR